MKIRKYEKYFALIGALLFCLPAILIIFLNYQGMAVPISSHIAADITSIIIFAIFCTISSVFISYALCVYLPRKWELKRLAKVAAVVISIGFFFTGWFPFIPGPIGVIHGASVVVRIIASTLFVVYVLIVTRHHSSWLLKLTCIALLVSMLFGQIVSRVFMGDFSDANFMLFQWLFILIFYMITIIMSFERRKNS